MKKKTGDEKSRDTVPLKDSPTRCLDCFSSQQTTPPEPNIDIRSGFDFCQIYAELLGIEDSKNRFTEVLDFALLLTAGSFFFVNNLTLGNL